jgi:maleylacetate reductase
MQTLHFVYEALPGRIVFGAGAVDQLADEVKRLNGQRVLGLCEAAHQAQFAELLRPLGAQLAGIFAEVAPHVPIATVERARAQARALAADCLVTFGGGSATGLGKAVALETGLPILAIPTTYAGSEMTPIYGITSEGQKRTGRSLAVLPRTVIYDPRLTLGLPPTETGPSGLNALAHCVEAMYAQAANPVTSSLAEEGVRVLYQDLPQAVAQPTDEAGRGAVLYGAYLAGTALAAVGMALHHRICHVLGGTFGLGHGQANAVILPHVVQYNAAYIPDAMQRLCRALATDDPAGTLFDFNQRIGNPVSLQELGMHEADLERVLQLTLDPPGYNPRPVEAASLRALLRQAFYGNRPAGELVG